MLSVCPPVFGFSNFVSELPTHIRFRICHLTCIRHGIEHDIEHDIGHNKRYITGPDIKHFHLTIANIWNFRLNIITSFLWIDRLFITSCVKFWRVLIGHIRIVLQPNTTKSQAIQDQKRRFFFNCSGWPLLDVWHKWILFFLFVVLLSQKGLSNDSEILHGV